MTAIAPTRSTADDTPITIGQAMGTWSVAWMSRRIGATRWFAKLRPNHTADSSTIRVTSANMDAKATWMPSRFSSSAW